MSAPSSVCVPVDLFAFVLVSGSFAPLPCLSSFPPLLALPVSLCFFPAVSVLSGLSDLPLSVTLAFCVCVQSPALSATPPALSLFCAASCLWFPLVKRLN